MSTVTNWLKSDTTEKESFMQELYEDAVSVEVYRSVGNTGALGIEKESATQEPLRNINVRIVDEISDSITAFTDDTDLLQNDRWRSVDRTGYVQWYKVDKILPFSYGSEVRLTRGK